MATRFADRLHHRTVCLGPAEVEESRGTGPVMFHSLDPLDRMKHLAQIARIESLSTNRAGDEMLRFVSCPAGAPAASGRTIDLLFGWLV